MLLCQDFGVFRVRCSSIIIFMTPTGVFFYCVTRVRRRIISLCTYPPIIIPAKYIKYIWVTRKDNLFIAKRVYLLTVKLTVAQPPSRPFLYGCELIKLFVSEITNFCPYYPLHLCKSDTKSDDYSKQFWFWITLILELCRSWVMTV